MSKKTTDNQELVKFLKDLVDVAKAGNMTGVVVGYVVPDGSVTTSWHAGDDSNTGMMLGAAQLLSYRVTKKADEYEEEE